MNPLKKLAEIDPDPVHPWNQRLLRVSAVLTLIALGFMVWSMLEPTPLPIMLAMSVGQVIGTLAFALYLFVVVRDLRRRKAK